MISLILATNLCMSSFPNDSNFAIETLGHSHLSELDATTDSSSGVAVTLLVIFFFILIFIG